MSNYHEHAAGYGIRACASLFRKACISHIQAQTASESMFLQCQLAKWRLSLGISIPTAFTMLTAIIGTKSPSGLCFFLQGRSKEDQPYEVCSTSPWGVCSITPHWATGSRIEAGFSPDPNHCSSRCSWKHHPRNSCFCSTSMGRSPWPPCKAGGM